MTKFYTYSYDYGFIIATERSLRNEYHFRHWLDADESFEEWKKSCCWVEYKEPITENDIVCWD